MAPTPVEVRQWKRDAQRAVRLATNALRGGKRKWENASSTGLDVANSLANGMLNTRYLPSMDWGVLSEIDDLRLYCKLKLRNQLHGDMKALAECLEALDGVMDEVMNAHETVRKMLEGPPWKSVLPVFISLSMSTICELFASARDMYIKEYEVKHTVVEGLRDILENIHSEESDKYRNPSNPPKSGQPALRDELQVLLATWMLTLHFEEEEVESSLGMLINETHTV